MFYSVIILLATLIAVHMLADGPLQGDFLAREKSPKKAQPSYAPWGWAMAAHSSIHALGVAYVTGLPALGFAEFFAHFAIDTAKCQGHLSFNQDQALHFLCKLIWVGVVYKYYWSVV